MVVGVGFKPTNLIKGTVLQTVAFSHSAIPPCNKGVRNVNMPTMVSHRPLSGGVPITSSHSASLTPVRSYSFTTTLSVVEVLKNFSANRLGR